MSERDYSWQPLSLHIISSGANRYFFSLSIYKRISLGVELSSRFIPNTPLSSPRPQLVNVRHVPHSSKYIRPYFSSLARALLSREMNFSYVFYGPLISSSFVLSCVLDLRAADQRAFYSLLIGYLKPAKPPSLRILRAPPRYGWESSLLWRTRHSFHSLTPSPKLHVSCDHLAVYVILYRTTP